ncbi:hypothetical protein [Flavobacterium luminosum]|uniref:Uncharacterized protein n=1 Tax=Flavobacterium luminosum TaxID=2949086 RepID=A0ABT0TLC7_9FLAO|nr:hypothetical protein [Flavobacterium sp. HXWNR70]MCL9808293.1 hypothetical protein [Flavobacterium sp. HXWNR70]
MKIVLLSLSFFVLVISAFWLSLDKVEIFIDSGNQSLMLIENTPNPENVEIEPLIVLRKP